MPQANAAAPAAQRDVPRAVLRVKHVAAILAVILLVAGLLGLDPLVYRRVSLVLNTPPLLDRDFYTITKPLWLAWRFIFAHVLGVAAAYVALVLFHPRGWRVANAMLIAVLVVALVANVAQNAIGRPRPNADASYLAFSPALAPVIFGRQASFPSGEAAMAFALAAVLSRAVPRGIGVWYTLAFLAAITRLVNGAHYVSDVAAGALFGLYAADALYVWLLRALPRLGPRAAPEDDSGKAKTPP